MTEKTETRIAWWRRRQCLWLLVGAVWSVAMLGLALPSWQQTVSRAGQVKTVERDLAALEQWSVAGLWLDKSVAVREPVVNGAWGALFPEGRRRESLFLDLAKVADRSGVADFGLEETESFEQDASYDPDDMSAGQPVVANSTSGLDFSTELPEVQPSSYRIRARFSGDYQKVAAFLSGLQTIERAVSVQSLIIRPNRDGIAVDLELDVYVSESTQS